MHFSAVGVHTTRTVAARSFHEHYIPQHIQPTSSESCLLTIQQLGSRWHTTASKQAAVWKTSKCQWWQVQVCRIYIACLFTDLFSQVPMSLKDARLSCYKDTLSEWFRSLFPCLFLFFFFYNCTVGTLPPFTKIATNNLLQWSVTRKAFTQQLVDSKHYLHELLNELNKSHVQQPVRLFFFFAVAQYKMFKMTARHGWN